MAEPLHKRPWLWLAVFIIGLGVVYLIVREPAPTLPVRQALVEAVHETLGATVNWGHKRDRLQGFNLGQRGEDAYLLWLYLRAETDPDKDRLRQGLLQDAQTLLQRLSTDAAFDSIQTYRITSFLLLPNDDGLLEETAVAQFVLTREAARQFRWKRLTLDDFEHLLRTEGELRFHRTLR